jgi:hypothetical protein
MYQNLWDTAKAMLIGKFIKKQIMLGAGGSHP